MAEIVTGAMGTLLPKLANLIKGEYNLQKRLRGEIMFLESELKSMEAALIKVSEAPIDQPPDIQVKLWTREVRELSYDLEDSIDRFMVRIDGGKQPSKQLSFKGFIDRSLTLLTKGKIRHNIGIDIKDIRRRIKDVSERRDRYKVDQVPSKPVSRTIDNLRLSALYRKATELVGTEERSNYLVKRLMEGDQTSKQQVIVSIVGFGGLGKTTLANVVYEKLKGQFDCYAFVSVSHNPNMNKIFKNMLHQLEEDKYKNVNEVTWGEDQLIKELRKHLQHKRYFIVIDDIWDTSVWETIQYALIENDCGSRIITTTRILDVAKQVGGIYQLQPLCPTDSTKLFYQRIFGSEDKCPDNYLTEVSRKILKKCGGVPLAIITIASMLANKSGKENTQNFWSNVCQSMGSGVDDSSNVNNMRRILSVSYYDLPPHLRTCLLYFCLYPEDYEIRAKDLIWKWVGEGFVHREQGKSLYEVGEGYIDELVNKSMIQPAYNGHGSMTISCRVHDMVLDLLNFLSNEENFITTLGCQQPMYLPNKIRRLSLQTSKEEDIKQLATMGLSHVRSLTVFNGTLSLLPFLSTFQVLRALDLSGCQKVDNENSKDIWKLFHLRYLNLHGTSITDIPEDIVNLQFLTVVDVSGCEIIELPSSFLGLKHLQHLHVNRISLPRGFGNMNSLRELDIAATSPTMLQDLGKLTELSSLSISFHKKQDMEIPILQCISNLVNLKSLEIRDTISRLDYGCDNLCPGPQQLCSKNVKAARGICAVPRWVSSLCSLSSLCITLLTLTEQNLQVLGSIPALSHLSVVVKATHGSDERLVIGSGYPFRCLTTLRIVWVNGFMDVSFAPASLQNLKALHLELSPERDPFDDFDFGLEHLSSLEHVFVTLNNSTASDSEKMSEAEAAIRNALDMNPNKPVVIIMKDNELAVLVERAALQFIQGLGVSSTN
ncbi:unnamed protein product [Urochloa decumbens]|uniref:Uncharacterized protein n=1 Tax=Urochloa decumbens TaxID=240449 RepID=A0ABC9B3J0_9POAL